MLLAAALSVSINAFSNGRPGAPINYFINVRNSGTADLAALMLNNPLPQHTRFLGEEHPDGTTCSPALTCTIPALRAGGSALFILTVQIDSQAPQQTAVVDTVTVGDASDTSTLLVSGAVYQTADVSVATSGPATSMAGAEITYDVSVVNDGPYDATNVVIVDTIPPNATFVSARQTSGPPFTCGGGPPGSRGSGRCSIGTLAKGATAAFNVTARIDPGCASRAITNAIAVSSDTPNFLGKATSTSSTDVTAVPGTTADLAVMLDVPAGITPGALLVSTFTVINTGPADAANVRLTYALPPETAFIEVANPAGTSCTVLAPFGTGTVTCTIPKLANEAKMVFSVSIEVSTKPAATSIANSVSIAADTPDPDMAYNSMTANVLVDTADLVVHQTADNASVAPGGRVVYTIRVDNTGPAGARAVTVDDVLPDGATLVSVVPSQGLCNAVSCSLGAIASAASATVTVTITAPPSGGPITNLASAASATNDPTSKNNHASARVMVVAPVKGR